MAFVELQWQEVWELTYCLIHRRWLDNIPQSSAEFVNTTHPPETTTNWTRVLVYMSSHMETPEVAGKSVIVSWWCYRWIHFSSSTADFSVISNLRARGRSLTPQLRSVLLYSSFPAGNSTSWTASPTEQLVPATNPDTPHVGRCPTCVRASWVIGARGRWEWRSGTQSVTHTAPPDGLDDNSNPLMLQRGNKQQCRYIFT